MKIERILVEGYGQFAGVDLRLSPALTVVHGQNEAGKSTLFSFIRAVLFGFPSRKCAERYEVPSGPFGGELTLLTAQGPLTVRRMGGSGMKSEGVLSLQGLNGTPVPPSRLEQVLHGVSRELFYQVFAFSLTELATFEELARQGSVTEALFAAGMQGARLLPEVSDEWRRRSEELFGRTTQARRPLNLVLSRLEEVRAELESLGDRPARYFELQRTVTLLNDDVQTLQKELRRLREDHERVSMLHKVIPDLLALERWRGEWAQLPEGVEGFPQDGVARLEAEQQRRRAALAGHAELRSELERAQADRAKLEGALLSDETVAVLRSAESAFSGRQEQWRALPRKRADLAARRRQERDRLLSFGLQLDESGLLALDVGGAARIELAGLANAYERASRDVLERDAELRQLRLREEEAKEELSRREEEGAKLSDTPLPDLRRRLAALQRLPVLWTELRRCEEEHQIRSREYAEAKAVREEPPEPSVPSWWPIAAAVLGLVLVVAAVAFSGLPAAIIAALVAAALVAATFGLSRRAAVEHERQVRAYKDRSLRQQSHVTRVTEAIARLADRVQALTTEDSELQRFIGPAGGDLGREIERTEALIRGAERREQLEREYQSTRERNQRIAREVEVAQSRKAAAEHEAQRARQALEAFVTARGLPARVGAEGATSLFADLAHAQAAVRALLAGETALQAEAAECERAALALLQAAKGAGLATDDPERACAEVRALVERRAVEAQRITEAQSRLDELTRQLRRAESEREDAERAITTLFQRAGVQDEEAYRARAEQGLLRQRLSGEMRTHRAAIEAATQLSAEQAAEALTAHGGAEAVSARLQELSRKMEAVSARHAESVERRGSVQNELSALETDGAVAKLRAEEEELVRKAAVMARQYARDRLGLALLNQARKRFEEEQQPQVVKRASRHFAQLTAFKYGRAFVPADREKTELRVIDAQGNEFSAEQLSRGTREQLYLAFRLAVIEDFAEKRGPLPIVLDDILVNFDPGRAKNAVEVIARVAQTHQVIAFTCHPWMRELFAEYGGQVLELGAAAVPAGRLTRRSELASP